MINRTSTRLYAVCAGMDLGEAYAIQASLRSSAFFAAVCLKVSGKCEVAAIYIRFKKYNLYRLQDAVVKDVGHLGHDEAMEAGGREFEPWPGHYSRMSL